ncbi:MAG TPA: penicillin-binding protein 2 [Candidatus Acidoferrum sp.]|jgi:cell division protein FtsI (penicillin-binding protein 3)|nr:penicillin-binding protein 2 [Candidatus Acidoferrum sp.]
MATRILLRRLLWLTLLLGLAFAGLGYRLLDLQVLRHEELSALAQQNTQSELLLEPRRGDIVDVKGNLLATTVETKTVCAEPGLIGNYQGQVARVLAPLLQAEESKLARLLTPCLRQNTNGETITNLHVVLKRRLPVETWEKIQSAMTNLSSGLARNVSTNKAAVAALRNLGLKAVFAESEPMRAYPSQRLAAHVLGYAVSEEKRVGEVPVREIVGRDGIELTLNSKLAGVRGWRVTERDRQRRELVSWREQDIEAHDGLNVVLSIDSVVQSIVEQELAVALEKHSPISISGIVSRPRTGEILAMATLPNFDPNNLGGATADARRDRVVTDLAEPGSTFKIVVVSGALNDGLVRLTDTFDCEHGAWSYGGHTLHDHERYGVLSVENIITKSSNIGAGKIGVKMGPARLYDYIRDYGFGSITGIPLPAEAHGVVYPVSRWSKVSVAQLPMGQGLSVTRLQMVMAMCAIANQGWLMRPMLVERLEDRQHNVVASYSPQRVRQVVSESTAKEMVQALKTVVSPEGTAPKAALEHYTVAGKTGTAWKVENGFYVRKYFSSFIGFFPADNPELCISITMDEPKQGFYGGQVAAPAFKAIAERAADYLNIRPEDAIAPSIPATLAAPADSPPLKTAAAFP